MGKAPKELSTSTITSLRAILNSLDARFPVVASPEFGSLVNYSAQSDEPVHRWFRYREGYSTQLVQKILQEVQPRNLIVDPFCGAGTTLLVARNKGYASVGIDANPLSTFVARTKTRFYSYEQLQRFEEICPQIRILQPTDPALSPPKLSIIDKVFLPEVLNALLVLKHFIVTHLARSEHDFFFLAWLSILEEVSNVFKEGNGIKYRNHKRTPIGYVDIPIDVWQLSMFPEDKFDHVITVFLKRIKMMITDARQFVAEGQEPAVFDGDALSLDDYVQEGSASLVVFSPPYVNNFNYFKAFKVELWMGDFISDYTDLQNLTHRSLRSHVETRLSRETDNRSWYPEELDALLDLIDPSTLWTARIPQAIKGYFYDMRQVLENAFDCLEPGGSCIIVVGNSAYGSILIPTDALLAETAVQEGFQVDKIAVARHLTTSSQQKAALESVRESLRESILYLKKPKNSRLKPTVESGFSRYRYVEELPKFPREAPSTVYVVRNQGLTDLTHIIHKYLGKFIPHVPRWAIEKYLGAEKGRVLLDPFCGSGTSLVEAHVSGCEGYGIDIDPLARLISKVKTTPIDRGNLQAAIQEVEKAVHRNTTSSFRPSIETLDHWFSKETTQDLGVIREAIDPWKFKDADIYNFLLICMSSIVRRVSKADNQSLKTYVSGTYPKIAQAPKPLFLKTLQDYEERIHQFSESASPQGKTTILDIEDSRHFADAWLARGLPQVNLGITSPPYIKTIDYVYNQMAEYFWIGDLFGLQTQTEQNEAKRRYIGTDKVNASTYKEKRRLDIPAIDFYIDEVCNRDVKNGYIISRYFDDMRIHFQQMHQILCLTGTYVVVIGDSMISGIDIPTHELLAQVAHTQGFKLESQFAYEIRNRYMRFPRNGRGGTVDLDWIMTFRPF